MHVLYSQCELFPPVGLPAPLLHPGLVSLPAQAQRNKRIVGACSKQSALNAVPQLLNYCSTSWQPTSIAPTLQTNQTICVISLFPLKDSPWLTINVCLSNQER